MKTARITFAVLLLCLPPLGRYLSDFITGYFCKLYGGSLECALFIFLLVPILVGVAVGCLIPAKRILSRVVIGIVAVFLSGILALFGTPAGAITYSHGFECAIRTQVGIEPLQYWAQETLVEYQQGKIKLTNEPSYASPGDLLIVTNDLPQFLKSGIFKLTSFADSFPEISICKSGGRIGMTNDCIAISWPRHGLLIGQPGLTNQWSPWYCKELAPGIYSYCE